ncbi:MAG TPA: DNA mismatch repair endonuclease MutL [Longimicrobiales bacterium]
MPRRIRILPDNLANQIAAGEVVERPASVVKELVENALDAAATRVDVSIQNGGKTEIRVADDGTGMGREDALLALDRHATSKIASEKDLQAVQTFGFRGEALPSIASVSRLVLETAEPGGVGTRVRVAGGRILGVEDCARQGGTTVVARNLFFNVPARAKFLKSAAAETRAVADVVTTLALANLSAAFRLESNGRVLFELPAAPDLVSRVAAIWGEETAGRLVPVARDGGGVRVAGLVVRPDAAQIGPRRVHLFVGGRPFRDRELVQAAERAYRTTVPYGVRPSLYLYLEVEPGAVDVNVHPTKAEVRFRDRPGVAAAVEAAVREALGSLESAATLDRSPLLPQIRRAARPSAPEAKHDEPGQLAFFVAANPDAPGDGRPTENEAGEREAPGGTDAAGADAAAGRELAHADGRRPVLWQIHDTYILAETRSGLLIIDQHSAHERILFEAMMRGFSNGGQASQRLLFPLTLRLAPAEYAVVEDMRSLFAAAGFEIEPFGGRTVIVHAAPTPHPYFDAERCLRDMITELARGSELTRAARNQHERIAMTFACKGAIKAGQRLSQAEMAELFDRLFATELPSHDVHGRPTIVRLSLQELDRRFGRHG